MGDEQEVLVGGPRGASLWSRIPGRWRVRGTVAVAFCIGLALGGYGMHAWDGHKRPQRVRFDARLFVFSPPSSGETLQGVLHLRNAGRRLVTVDMARMEIGGFTVVSGGLRDPQTFARGGSTAIWYTLTPDLVASSAHGGTAHLRVRTPGGQEHWVTTKVTLDLFYASGSQMGLPASPPASMCDGSRPGAHTPCGPMAPSVWAAGASP